LGAVFFGEEYVVVLARIEGRVEIDEIDGLGLYISLEHFKVVAVIELVFISRHGIGLRLAHWGVGGSYPGEITRWNYAIGVLGN
jgi:hypothetical protein